MGDLVIGYDGLAVVMPKTDNVHAPTISPHMQGMPVNFIQKMKGLGEDDGRTLDAEPTETK